VSKQFPGNENNFMFRNVSGKFMKITVGDWCIKLCYINKLSREIFSDYLTLSNSGNYVLALRVFVVRHSDYVLILSGSTEISATIIGLLYENNNGE